MSDKDDQIKSAKTSSDDAMRLSDLQHWMQSVITNPEGVISGVHQASLPTAGDDHAADGDAEPEDQSELSNTTTEATRRIESVICPSHSMSSVERLQIYASGYYARLIECLQSVFPGLNYALGEEAFCGFVIEYLQRYPSRSYTLNRLADHFADFLQQTRPDAETKDQTAVDGEDVETEVGWIDFIIDLTRFELALDDVFDRPGVEGCALLLPDQLNGLDAERLATSSLSTVDNLRLLAFRFPISQYYSEFRRDGSPEFPTEEPTWMALTRRDYVVRRHDLSHPQFVLLTALQQGQTVGNAIAATAEVTVETTADLERLTNDLRSWFQIWTRAGLFRELRPTVQ